MSISTGLGVLVLLLITLFTVERIPLIPKRFYVTGEFDNLIYFGTNWFYRANQVKLFKPDHLSSFISIRQNFFTYFNEKETILFLKKYGIVEIDEIKYKVILSPNSNIKNGKRQLKLEPL